MYRIEFLNYYNNVVFSASKKSLSSIAHYGRIVLQKHESQQWWATIHYSKDGTYEHEHQIGYIDNGKLYLYDFYGEAKLREWDEI